MNKGASMLCTLRRLPTVEIDTGFRLLVSTTTVLTTWLVSGWVFGRRLGDSIADGDLSQKLRWFEQLQSLDDWRQWLVDVQLLGGVPLRDVFGVPPVHQIVCALPLSPIQAANLILIVAQILLVFLLLNVVARLTQEIEPTSRPRPLALACCSCVFGFGPVVLSRIFAWHENILYGLTVVVAGLALIAEARAPRRSLLCIGVALVSAYNGLCSYGYQIVLYGLVLAAPLWLTWIVWPQKTRPLHQRALLPTVVMWVALALAMPRLAAMLDYAASLDFPRPSGPHYLGALRLTAQDLMSSIPWQVDLFGKFPASPHERRYGIGALALLIFLLPTKRMGPLKYGLIFSLALLTMFALRLEPITGIFLWCCPLLAKFRIPGRALLLASICVQIFGAVALLAARSPAAGHSMKLDGWWSRQRSWLRFGLKWAGLFLLAGLVLWSPKPGAEVAVWVGSAGFVALHRYRPWLVDRFRPAVWLLLALAALGAGLALKAPAPWTQEQLLDTPRQLGQEALARYPALQQPLRRVRQVTMLPRLGMNSAAGMGLSSLGGYSNVTYGQRQLVDALRRRSHPLAASYRFDHSGPWIRALEALYNVHYRLWVRQGEVTLRPIQAGAGDAWIPRTVERVDRHADVARWLTAESQPSVALVERGLLVRADTRTRIAEVEKMLGATCEPQVDLEIIFDPEQRHFTTRVEVDRVCLLVVSMNFLERWRVETKKGTRLPTLPVYGALLGVIVPPGTHQLVAEPISFAPWWADLIFATGVLGALVLAWAGLFRQRP